MPVRRTRTLAVLTLASALLLAACGDSADPGSGTGGAGGASTSSAGVGGTPATGDHSATDAMFAQMMIPHHAQAIEMSDLLLAKDGVDPQVAALAGDVKAAQGPQIDRMTGWLHGWGEDVPAGADPTTGMDHSGMGDLDVAGMMSEADLQDLADADGPAASRLFLEQMIEHHRGAVEMAQAQVSSGRNAEAVELAQAVVDAQRAQIEQMQALLPAG